MKRETYLHGLPGKKWGIWNCVKKEFQFGICEDTPMLAQARLFQKIGDNARRFRFEPRVLPKGEIPPSRADAIRAMTDEQLATTMLSIAGIGDQIDFCLYKPECEQLLGTNDDIPDEWCHACMLRWLRTPEKAGDPNG